MDIRSKLDYPAGALTNFAPYCFEIDGVKCASMEGFLQSLKADNLLVQKEICQLVGIEAKNLGNEHNTAWKKTQTLFWQGRKYDRQGTKYQELLDRAYDELAKNEEFRKALLATGQEVLTHSIGKSDPFETILTEDEFCSRLMQLRSKIY
ncbi:MAG: hypothetical protein KC736_02930 [Candidatus Moranbacteria bacterium]|nr:hypothetical protein [Candidatus Moranbacteria bacterium]